MRVTLSELRDIRRKGARWRPPPKNARIVVPSAIRRKAICLYHDESYSDALAYLDGRRPDGSRGLSGSFGPGGKRARQGQQVRDSFRRYATLERRDSRPAAELSLGGDVRAGTHEISTTVDVIVFADEGYSGRVLNWDRAGVTDELAQVMSVPAALLIEQELGEGTCVDVEIWDLENGTKWLVPYGVAVAQAGEIIRLIDRAETMIGQ